MPSVPSFIAGLALAFAASSAAAATYFVATDGSDATGTGGTDAPWRTIGTGLARIAGGDTLIVRAGTYAGVQNFINAGLHPVPSGNAAQYTVIAAEQPYAVRIRNDGALDYEDNPLLLDEDTHHVRVDGFVFEVVDSVDPPYIAALDGDHAKVTRVLFRRAGVLDAYGGWVRVGGDDNLLEDCAGVGAARYGFSLGGPTSTAQRNVFRRCVGRVDYSTSNQPKATFGIYGNDSVPSQVRDVLLQNCIAIDSRKGPDAGEPTYAGFYFPKSAAGVTIQGSIALNVEAQYAGFFVRELQAQQLRMEHTLAWGGYGSAAAAGIRANSNATGEFTLDHVTVGAYPLGYYNDESASTRSLRNSLFAGNGALTSNDAGWTVLTHNAFAPASQAQGSAPITVASDVLRHLLRAAAGTPLIGAANDGGNVGATIMQRYGAGDTLWGEPGFDALTADPLWPWPYEDAIKPVFAEPNPPPAGAVPSSNDTTRGFCAANDAYGKPMTLTRYLWQYLGHEIPADVYAMRVVFANGFE